MYELSKDLEIVKYTFSVADGNFLLSRNDGGLKEKLVSLGIEVMVEQNLVAMSVAVCRQLKFQ